MSNYGPFFKILRKIKIIFTKRIITPIQKEFTAPCVYIGHHQNMFGPVNFMTFCPVDVRIWAFSAFLDRKECYKHFSEYTFMERFQMHPVFSKVFAGILSCFVPPLLKSMNAISVHRLDSHNNRKQIFQTIEDSVTALLCNQRVLIFPDIDYTSSKATCGRFYSGFSRIEKLYYEKTKKHVCFVPVYISKSKRKMVLGKSFMLSGASPSSSDLKQIVQAMQNGINELAAACNDI
jgi:hypothetical protein